MDNIFRNTNSTNDDIKVVQMNNLEEVVELPTDDVIQSLNTSDIDSDSDSDSDSDTSDNNSVDGVDNVQEDYTAPSNENTNASLSINYKNESVATLRNLAEEKNLIPKGSKPTKKELLQIFENGVEKNE